MQIAKAVIQVCSFEARRPMLFHLCLAASICLSMNAVFGMLIGYELFGTVYLVFMDPDHALQRVCSGDNLWKPPPQTYSVLFGKLIRWPAAFLFPTLDALRYSCASVWWLFVFVSVKC